MASSKRKSKRNKQLRTRTGTRRRTTQIEPLEARHVLTTLLPGVPVTFNEMLTAGEVEFLGITLNSALDLDDGDTLVIDTLGSSLSISNDTELGLYNDVGDVLAINDDIDLGGGDFLSRLNLPDDLTTGQTMLPSLPSGDFTIAAGAYNTIFNSGLDGMDNPNATSSSTFYGPLQVNVTLSQNNFGTLTSGATVTDTDPLVAEEVKLFRFELSSDVTAANGASLVIDTLGSDLTMGDFFEDDTEIGLYDDAGNLLAENDDFNLLPTSELSFGDGGANGDLTAGTYFLAAGSYNTTFNANFDATSTSVATGDIQVNLNLTTPTLDPLVVTTTVDVINANDGQTSLREAINFASGTAGLNTVTFDPAVFSTPQTIFLDSALGALDLGEEPIIVDGPLDGTNQPLVTVDAGGGADGQVGNGDGFRVFQALDAAQDVQLNGLRVTGGDSYLVGGGIYFGRVDHTLTLNNTVVTGNASVTDTTINGGDAFGGGVNSYGNLVLNGSTVSGNIAMGTRGWGGGILSFRDIQLNDSQVMNNSAVSHAGTGNSDGRDAVGGGIWSGNGQLSITNSQVTGNTATGGDSANASAGAGRGGGIAAGAGGLTLTDSIVSGNAAIGGSSVECCQGQGGNGAGGGIYGIGPVLSTRSTISDNSASGGSSTFLSGAASGGGVRGLGQITLYDSHVTGNTLAGGEGSGSGSRGGDVSGGGISGAGDMSLFNSTVLNNTATGGLGASQGDGGSDGGGIFAEGYIVVSVSSIVSGNTAQGGGTMATGVYASGDGGGRGGGVAGNGPITLIGATVSGNSALGGSGEGRGGGISGLGLVKVSVSSKVTNNMAVGATTERYFIPGGDAAGGGIWTDASSGGVALYSSQVSGNAAIGGNANPLSMEDYIGGNARGGGISSPSVFSSLSTVSGNTAEGGAGSGVPNTIQGDGAGGGIYTSSQDQGQNPRQAVGGVFGLSVSNSTVSGNTASGSTGTGGGIFTHFEASDGAIVRLDHATVFDNSATSAGGGLNIAALGSHHINNSVVAGNAAVADPDISGAVTTAFSLIGGDPMLAPLADNGGNTMTHLPLPGSPVINAGDPNAMVGDGTTSQFDQRGFGFSRVVGGRTDIGAVELQSVTTPACDFNGDGVCDGDDIDALQDNIVNGPADPAAFDLNNDGVVNIADRDVWLALAGAENLASGNPYLLGDANLDGTVDGQDFIAWNSNKFTSSSNWTDGDFNADGTVDGQDFIVWNSNKFTSADSVFAPTASRFTQALSDDLHEDDEDDRQPRHIDLVFAEMV